jgi:hypothetical protein
VIGARVGASWAARVALVAVLIGSAGCVASTRPDGLDCAAPTLELELTLSDSELTPAPSACRGQTVTLRVASSTEGVLHVHGYDEEIPVLPVAPGEVSETTFEAVRSGQFLIQLHAFEAPEVSVAVLTVHEP